MTPPPRDDASSYADGHPDAVRRARPPEPSEAAWEEMRLRIQARVATPAVAPAPAPSRRWNRWGAAVLALTATAAAVIALVLLSKPPAPRSTETPEVVKRKPVPPPTPDDPLAEWDVLPMASAEEVVLQRVPGDGWLPVGLHPFDGELTLATAAEVELDENPEWPTAMVPSPKHAPMIFATKPR